MKAIKIVINIVLVLIFLMILLITYAFFILEIHHFIFGICLAINLFTFGFLITIKKRYK